MENPRVAADEGPRRDTSIEALGKLRPTTDRGDLGDVDLVVEAIPESEALKCELFEDLGRICPAGTVLASNTSSISITRLARASARPDRFIGMHFMNPVPVMQLVEVIRGQDTGEDTFGMVMDTARSLEKIPVEAHDYPGFVANRVLMPMINEAVFCLMEGVAEGVAIDTVMKLGMNHPMGPLTLAGEAERRGRSDPHPQPDRSRVSLTSALRQNSNPREIAGLLSDGSNLAAYLRSLEQATDDTPRAAWRRIHQLVQRIAPFIKKLQPTPINPGAPDESPVRLDWVDERDQVFGPHQLSDGTLRCIALFTALAQPVGSMPAFISIDEPELGLHPAALALFASLVRSASAHAQVLLATQSPALLDFFEPREVVVAERVDGSTVLRRLEPDALASWLEDYTLSDLYDKNILGGRP